MNRVILLGNLGRDAETAYTRNGKPYARLSLVTTNKWKDQSGTLKEESQWHNIVIWGREGLHKYLTKGCKVFIEGELTYNSYTDKEGIKRYFTSIQVGKVGSIDPFCGGGKRERQSGDGQREKKEEHRADPRPASSIGAFDDVDEYQPDDDIPY